MVRSSIKGGEGGGYERMEIHQYPRIALRETPEQRYWSRFRNPILVKEYAAVNNVEFSPVSPYDFAVTSSARVQLFSASTNSVRKTITRFKDTAYGATYRDDGKLLVAGGEAGIVQVFDVDSRIILRTFKGHTRAVHAVRFVHGTTKVVSCSDDHSIRGWDMPTEAEVVSMYGHEDYVRTCRISPVSADVWVTGSYDHTVRLWDARSGQSVMTMQHGAPVEDAIMASTGSVLLSAGGNEIKVWDILAGGRALNAFSNHQKTITTISFDNSGRRLLSGSLDQNVKVYDVTNDYKVMHTMKYTAPVLSLAVSPKDTHLVVGMSSGLLNIKRRLVGAAESAASKESRRTVIRAGTHRFFVRGKNRKPGLTDFRVERERKRTLRPYDKMLRRFEYPEALDEVLGGQHRPVVVISLLEELKQRGGLLTALAGRDEVTVEPLVVFMLRHITNPRFAALLVEIANHVLDMYGGSLGQSPHIDGLFLTLQHKIHGEISFQREMHSLMGMLDCLLVASATIGSSSSR